MLQILSKSAVKNTIKVMAFKQGSVDLLFSLLIKYACRYFTRAVTIHQTHDSVHITIFDPRFGSYHDFYRGVWEKKKNDF